MPGPHYSFEQLNYLRESPLIRKPDNLPTIEQWIETPTDQNSRRPRTQTGPQNGKADENEHPTKRLSVFEGKTISRQSHIGTGDDVFLGPKISFASATAARQPKATTTFEERPSSTTESSRIKKDWYNGRDKTLKDKEDRHHDRSDNVNGHHDSAEGPSRFRARRDSEGKEDRGGRDKSRNLQDREGDGDRDPRRSGHSRGKFEQPWFRDGNKEESKEPERSREESDDRGWRDKDRQRDSKLARNGRGEQDPHWLNSSGVEHSHSHTQDDFQKWKDQMKAGSSDPEIKATEPGDQPIDFDPTTGTSIGGAVTALEPGVPDQFFGLWGDAKREEKKVGLAGSTAKASAARSKSSRFAGFFAPPQQEAPSQPPKPASPSPAQSPTQHTPQKNTVEDQVGFQRMMSMLRMGGNSLQAQSTGEFALPATAQPLDTAQLAPILVPDSPNNIWNASSQDVLRSPDQLRSPRPPSMTQPPSSAARREAPSRDSEYLLNLMQQPRPPFAEGQIYGQSYNRNQSDDISALLNNIAAKPQTPPRMKGPPPGLFNNDGAFAVNQGISSHIMPGQRFRRSTMETMEVMDDRFTPGTFPKRRSPPHEKVHQLQTDQHRIQQPLNFDPNPSPWPQHNLPFRTQATHESLAPPPGFLATRAPAPPGFFQLPAASATALPQRARPPGLRQPPPQQLPIPMFASAQGYVPPEVQVRRPQGYGQGQQAAFDALADVARRTQLPGMQPMGHAQYVQYLKQFGNGAAYQGVP